jgi:hypothetical protein
VFDSIASAWTATFAALAAGYRWCAVKLRFNNSPEMQKAAEDQKDENSEDKVKADVGANDAEQTREDIGG